MTAGHHMPNASAAALRDAARKRPTGRGIARLGAVQALFQIEFTGAADEAVLSEFLDYRLAELAEAAGAAAIDRDFFASLVNGIAARREELDGLIGPLLVKGWKLERLDSVLRAILRAAAFELAARSDVPTRVVINEYVEIAHAFFADREAGFVNAVLDPLARRLRPTERGTTQGDETTDTG